MNERIQRLRKELTEQKPYVDGERCKIFTESMKTTDGLPIIIRRAKSFYEVLDKNGAEYEKTDASTILAEMSVYGNLSRFSVSVNEQETGTELTVTMIHPCEGLSDAGIRRATTAIADSISQHLENELVINKVSVQRQPV